MILTGEEGRSDVGEAIRLMAEQGVVDVTTLRLEHMDHVVIHGERLDIPATKYIAEVESS